jgi:hypothetical protein
MSEMSLPCSMKKMRHEVRLISKQDLTITSRAEIAQLGCWRCELHGPDLGKWGRHDRNKEERKDGTKDKDVPPEDITVDQTTTIHANMSARLGTVKRAQRSSVCGNERHTVR